MVPLPHVYNPVVVSLAVTRAPAIHVNFVTSLLTYNKMRKFPETSPGLKTLFHSHLDFFSLPLHPYQLSFHRPTHSWECNLPLIKETVRNVRLNASTAARGLKKIILTWICPIPHYYMSFLSSSEDSGESVYICVCGLVRVIKARQCVRLTRKPKPASQVPPSLAKKRLVTTPLMCRCIQYAVQSHKNTEKPQLRPLPPKKGEVTWWTGCHPRIDPPQWRSWEGGEVGGQFQRRASLRRLGTGWKGCGGGWERGRRIKKMNWLEMVWGDCLPPVHLSIKYEML